MTAIFLVPLLPCPVTAAYCGVSFPVGASSLTGPIAVLVCLHLSWQVGSLLICSSSTSSQSLGFWIEKPLQDKSALRIMNLSSTLCNLLWFVGYSTQQWWLCFLVFVFLAQVWITQPCTLWLFTVWAWPLWSCLSFTLPSRRKERGRVLVPWETKMLVSKEWH